MSIFSELLARAFPMQKSGGQTASKNSEIDIQLGVIRSVNITEENNVRKVRMNVMSFLDLFVLTDIPVDSPLHAQYVPVVGQYVLLLRASNFTRVISYFGEEPFKAPLQPGEFMSEGSGGGFLYLNGVGDATIGDACLSNVQRMLAGIGISITSTGYSLNVKNVGQINITPKDDVLGNEEQIEIIKTKDGGVTGRIVLTNDKTMVYAATIELGKDPDINSGDVKGGVICSRFPFAPTGSYDFDTMTGRPIPRSYSVKVSI